MFFEAFKAEIELDYTLLQTQVIVFITETYSHPISSSYYLVFNIQSSELIRRLTFLTLRSTLHLWWMDCHILPLRQLLLTHVTCLLKSFVIVICHSVLTPTLINQVVDWSARGSIRVHLIVSVFLRDILDDHGVRLGSRLVWTWNNLAVALVLRHQLCFG